jgi:hypothetical protein
MSVRIGIFVVLALLVLSLSATAASDRLPNIGESTEERTADALEELVYLHELYLKAAIVIFLIELVIGLVSIALKVRE